MNIVHNTCFSAPFTNKYTSYLHKYSFEAYQLERKILQI